MPTPVTQVWQRTPLGPLGGLTESGQCVAGESGAVMLVGVTYPGAQSSPHGQAITPLQIAAGGHGPALTYTAAGLPAGLSIGSGNGQITGTPTTTGLSSPVVTVTDAASGASESVQFDWTVT
jgi:hypothetical protein